MLPGVAIDTHAGRFEVQLDTSAGAEVWPNSAKTAEGTMTLP